MASRRGHKPKKSLAPSKTLPARNDTQTKKPWISIGIAVIASAILGVVLVYRVPFSIDRLSSPSKPSQPS